MPVSKSVVRPIELFVHSVAIDIQLIHTEEDASFLKLRCQSFEFLLWIVEPTPLLFGAFMSACRLNNFVILAVSFRNIYNPFYSFGVVLERIGVEVSHSESQLKRIVLVV